MGDPEAKAEGLGAEYMEGGLAEDQEERVAWGAEEMDEAVVLAGQAADWAVAAWKAMLEARGEGWVVEELAMAEAVGE